MGGGGGGWPRLQLEVRWEGVEGNRQLMVDAKDAEVYAVWGDPNERAWGLGSRWAFLAKKGRGFREWRAKKSRGPSFSQKVPFCLVLKGKAGDPDYAHPSRV